MKRSNKGSKKRLRTVASDRHIISVETPRTRRKLFQVHFSGDGGVFLHFPYFLSPDGFVSVARRRRGLIDYLSGGAVTSQRVKFSHHVDGRAHFSQTGRVRTEIRRQGAPLATLTGPLFIVRCQGIGGFAELTSADLHDQNLSRFVVGAAFDRDIASFDMRGDWYLRSKLVELTEEESLGPLIQFRSGSTDRTGAILGPRPGKPPHDHVLLLSCRPVPPTRENESFILMMGAFDSSFSFFEPQADFGFLLLAYPRGSVEAVSDVLPSIDWRPKRLSSADL